LQHLLTVRRATPEFAGTTLIGFDAKNPHIVAYQRPGSDSVVLCLVNVSDTEQLIAPLTLSGLPPLAIDLLTDARLDLRRGLSLPAHGVLWLRV